MPTPRDKKCPDSARGAGALTRTRRFSFTLIVFFLFLISLAATELILRLHDFSFYYNFGADILGLPLLELHSLRRVMNRTVDFDPYLFWRFKPNQDLTFSGAYKKPVHINGQGFRGPDFTPQKPHGVFRIACLGDSTTFGWSVGDDETYPAQLSALLKTDCPGSRVEVLNLGVTGYTSLQGRELMARYVKDWRPDLVLFAFGPNDRLPALKSDAEHLQDRTWEISPLTVFMNRFQVYKLIKSGVIYLQNRIAGLTLDPATYLPRLKRKVSAQEFADNLAAVRREGQEIGADLIFIAVDFPSLPPDHLEQELKKRAAAAGAELSPDGETYDAGGVIPDAVAKLGLPSLELRSRFTDHLARIEQGEADPLRAFSEERAWPDQYRGEYWRWLMVDNGHPNPWGHELIARALRDQILDRPGFQRACNSSPQTPGNPHE